MSIDLQKLKFKKLNKGIFQNRNKDKVNKNILVFGKYGLQTKQKGSLTFKQIEAVRKKLAKNIKGVGVLWVLRFPDQPKTKRSAESRMGKGKGNFDHLVCKVRAGTVLFEISECLDRDVVSILENVKNKFSLPLKVIVEK